jgi:hypothetical protein
MSATNAYKKALALKIINAPWVDHHAEIVVAFRRVDADNPLIEELRRCVREDC